MVFKTEVQLQKAMENACTIAINNTCEKLWEVLQSYIMSEYYNRYSPNEYERTFQFYRSALYRMVSTTCGEIFMESGVMHYTGKSPVWTGEQQLLGAQTGYHGQLRLKGGGSFWTKFLAYFSSHALPMLKKELQAQGIPVK